MKAIVLGDGLYGAFTAFLLQEAGVNTLLVGPRDARPASATEISGGLLRVVDLDLPLARLALSGVDTFRNWRSRGLPGVCGYDACGAIFLADQAKAIEKAEAVAALGDGGYPIQKLSTQSLQALFPALRVSSDTIAFFEPFGGYGSSRETRYSLIDGFRRLGGEYRKLETVAIETGQGIVASGAHATMRFKADRIVIAAGRGTRSLLEKAGVLPIDDGLLNPRTIGMPRFEAEDAGIKVTVPVLVDLVHGTFSRPLEQGGFLAGAGNDGQEVGEMDSPVLTSALINDARSRITLTVPRLKGALHIGGDVGVDVYTDAMRPVVGCLSQRPSVFMAVGFSGRGYKIAPPISAALAGAVLCSLGARTSELIERIAVSEVDFQNFVISPDRVFSCTSPPSRQGVTL